MTHTDSGSRSSVLKRLVGAFVGATTAVVLYGVYDLAAPSLQAYISSELRANTERRYNMRSLESEAEDQLSRIAERARAIIEEEPATSSALPTPEPTGEESVIPPTGTVTSSDAETPSPRQQRIAARVQKSPPEVPFPEWLSVPEGGIESWKEYPPPSSFVRKEKEVQPPPKGDLPESGPALWLLPFLALFVTGLVWVPKNRACEGVGCRE